MTAGLVPRFDPDEPDRSHVTFKGADEYGIRTYTRTIPLAHKAGVEETWVISPLGIVMLYTHHSGGRLLAAYRGKPKRAKA